MRILYETGSKPLKGDTKVGEMVHNERDGITYTKNKYGDIIVVMQPQQDGVPIGCIVLYTTTQPLPYGYLLCDGTHNTPDLTASFLTGTEYIMRVI